MQLSKRMIEFRKANKLTQKEFADMVGVTDSAISCWEKRGTKKMFLRHHKTVLRILRKGMRPKQMELPMNPIHSHNSSQMPHYHQTLSEVSLVPEDPKYIVIEKSRLFAQTEDHYIFTE